METRADVMQLKYLIGQLEKITEQQNESLTRLGKAKSEVQILDTEYKKICNMKNLTEEAIKAEKKYFDMDRR